ncbi:formyl-CoA transferase/succinyl-CoA--D-citramalate CoA-transferase [Amycolatopsis bartoniae]|uniref:Succinyl-CoA--D-citramalate CoA-transferase n=1 Tax=Amycolatopsis bartoniae TaxID=941986 RepID=A0A8H9M8I0_9PSEU|nr:CoA transferase [Amycolatopsis bartoniae]MBB2937896.1 formyl-CoA transferase/succinyl-CoA--D-citramalate CoA-transferase [Amycolatopsis bartoniae]GHF41533.1 succinyl-CoA--D-citramalate CoA-transferase [Amycolatopsis bartoniae]
MGPLHGTRVLELGSFIAGPFAGQLLADYGAEVVKIEPPATGDPMRRWGITKDGESLWWPAIARNKKSVTVDLRGERGQELVRELAATADVVLENFRPGTLRKWGLDYETLSALNPGIVVVHVSGFGQTGPNSGLAGFGSVAEAVGGIRHTTGSPDDAPARTGISLGDSLAALFAVIGTQAALLERARSGRGQEVDVAIYEAVFALMESTLADYHAGGVLRKRSGSVLPGVAPSNVYPTADGAEVVIAANADTVFARLAEAMGQPELATDERYATHQARGARMAELDALVSAWTSARKSDELIDELNRHGVPVGRINTAASILTDPHFAAREMIQWRRNQHGTELPMNGVVPKFSRTPGEITRTGPALGADTDEVLAAVADGERLGRLRADGVV